MIIFKTFPIFRGKKRKFYNDANEPFRLVMLIFRHPLMEFEKNIVDYVAQVLLANARLGFESLRRFLKGEGQNVNLDKIFNKILSTTAHI